MPRPPTRTWCSSIVVVRREDRVLLVQERKHSQRWYFPAGGVESGESFAQAALRETREEAGVDISLDGILRVEHSPARDNSARLRVMFVAHVLGEGVPKQVADLHSLRAAWVTRAELEQLPLRGQEVKAIVDAVAAGVPLAPVSLLAAEGTPYRP